MSSPNLKATSYKHIPRAIINEFLSTLDVEYNSLCGNEYRYKYQVHGKLFIFFDYLNKDVKHALALHSNNNNDIHYESLSTNYVIGDQSFVKETKFASEEFSSLFTSGYSSWICIDVMDGYTIVRKQKPDPDNLQSGHIKFIEECISGKNHTDLNE